MSYREHERRAEAAIPRDIRCGIITISDTRTLADDTSGALINDTLVDKAHIIVRYEIVKDEPTQITALVDAMIEQACKVIITNGGTGIARRDSTFEAIDALLEKRLTGFGEIFRMLSYESIGPAAMLSRATAGVYHNTLIFCLPGSTNAVQLALDKLIAPELAHLVWETIRQ